MSVSVTVEGLQKTFGGQRALENISLSVAEGELMALLGPSGSGKTTLLRVIAGLEQADKGRVLFGDTDATHLSLRERRIGMVFQHYALFRHMTVFENIAYGLKARPRKERPSRTDIRQRVMTLLDLVQLSGLDQRYPAQLSGGQRQRVALARALAIEPRVLLLDEPFGALDAKVRKELRRWLREMHERTGHTTLFVTHDQDEAMELADRVAIMNHARIEQVGTPDDIYDRSASPFVCDFIGDMNRIPVQIAGGLAYFNGSPVASPPLQSPSGEAILYVRPQDLRLVDEEPFAFSGTVDLVRRTGATRRADIKMTGLETRLEIEVPTQTVLDQGQRVFLKIAGCRLFSPCSRDMVDVGERVAWKIDQRASG